MTSASLASLSSATSHLPLLYTSLSCFQAFAVLLLLENALALCLLLPLLCLANSSSDFNSQPWLLSSGKSSWFLSTRLTAPARYSLRPWASLSRVRFTIYSQPGTIFTPKGKFGDVPQTFVIVLTGEEDATGTSWIEVRSAAKLLQCTEQHPPTELSFQNVNSNGLFTFLSFVMFYLPFYHFLH